MDAKQLLDTSKLEVIAAQIPVSLDSDSSFENCERDESLRTPSYIRLAR